MLRDLVLKILEKSFKEHKERGWNDFVAANPELVAHVAEALELLEKQVSTVESGTSKAT